MMEKEGGGEEVEGKTHSITRELPKGPSAQEMLMSCTSNRLDNHSLTLSSSIFVGKRSIIRVFFEELMRSEEGEEGLATLDLSENKNVEPLK